MCVLYQIYMRQMNIYKKGTVFGERIYPVIVIFYLETCCLDISSKGQISLKTITLKSSNCYNISIIS